MGTWTLESISGNSSDFDTGQLFGTNVYVTFKLLYTPKIGQQYKETPKLEWNETIMMNEHHKSETWVFQTNMYTHNPASKTLLVWCQRYLRAYDFLEGKQSNEKGYVKLFNSDGSPLSDNAIELGIENKSTKADKIRTFLKKNGGILEIQVHDIPSINRPDQNSTDHKERVLNFDCGIEGSTSRYRAQQYLVVDGSKDDSQWVRKFSADWPLGIKTTGLTKVDAPASVSNPRDPLFMAGECW